MTTLPSRLWADLLGKPFREDARGPDAYDCVGLLLEIERRLGHTLPPIASDTQVLPAIVPLFDRVDEPRPGDAILIESCNPDWHIGIVTGPGWMIHAHVGCGVARERYDAFPWHKRIEGFYRWRAA
ncbi:MAG: NlpC/P60 family protein [Acidobacteriaceae bacterium]